jgi:RHS repeat-associated protein
MDARGKSTDFEYDALNRRIAMINPLNHRTEYDYDALGRLVETTDALNRVTGYEYDALDRLTAVVENAKPGDPVDNETNVCTQYGYDPVGNLTSITDANDHVTHFVYDLLDRLIRETDAEDHVWRYEYDPVGNLTRRIDANGDVTDYAYDADDLLTEIVYPDDSEITFAYDESHNQVRMVDDLGVTRNTYDALDRLTASTNHLGQRVGYAYDPAGNRTAVTYPDDRTVRTEYNATNYPVRVIDPDGRTFEATYDRTHNLTEIQYPNLTRAEITYDDAGRLTSVLNVQNDGDVISSFDYTLDDVGNRTHVEAYYRWRQPRALDNDYAYDPLDRLVRSSDSEGRFTEYVYDAVGNRRSMTSNYDPLRTPTDVKDPYTVDYDYSSTNRLLSTDHNVFGVTEYTYDANGNRVRREGPDVWVGNKHDVLRTDYTYDYENRLTSVKNYFDAGNGKWSLRDESAMTYDGYGRLFRRMHDQHQGGGGQKWTDFVYDGLDPIVEYVEPNPQYVNYYRGFGRILEQHGYKSQESPDGTAYFYHHDGLGSVSAITKHRGQAAHTYRYWDYGMALDKNDGTADSSNFTNPHNHYTYTGQNWDDENALYHFYAREYDPVTGVWLQQDPYRGKLAEPGTLHRYGFVNQNPVTYVDLLGMDRHKSNGDAISINQFTFIKNLGYRVANLNNEHNLFDRYMTFPGLGTAGPVFHFGTLQTAGINMFDAVISGFDMFAYAGLTSTAIVFHRWDAASTFGLAGIAQLDSVFANLKDSAHNLVRAFRGQDAATTKHGEVSELVGTLFGEEAVTIIDAAKEASDVSGFIESVTNLPSLAKKVRSLPVYDNLINNPLMSGSVDRLKELKGEKVVEIGKQVGETILDTYQVAKSETGRYVSEKITDLKKHITGFFGWGDDK